MPTLSEFKTEVESDRERGRQFQRARDEIPLLLSIVQQGRILQPINDVIAQVYRAYLEASAAKGDSLTISDLKPSFVDAKLSIPGLFRQMLDSLASTIVGMTNSDLAADLTTPMLRSITGLPIDAYGRVKPRPGNIPPTIRGDSMTENEILAHASPLLVISGDSALEDREPTINEIAPPARTRELTKPQSRDQLDEDLKKTRLSPWDVALGAILARLLTLPAAVVTRNRRGDSQSSTAKFVRDALGYRVPRKPGALRTPDVRTGGILRQIELLTRRETLGMHGQDKDANQDRIDQDIYVGYILHSVFAENTAPDHAARDGFRFYRDNRAGSSLPWSQRIVPPYRINCLCFTQELYEDPDGEEKFADWQAWDKFRGAKRIRPEDVGRSVWDGKSGGFRTVQAEDVGTVFGRPAAPSLEPRDVATWEKWFDAQRPGVQEKLIGQRRFFGALSRGSGRLRYRDVVDTNGSIMSTRRIIQESAKDRELRRKLVGKFVDVTQREHIQAWEGGGGKWDLSGMDEVAYQRRLRRFLASVTQ